MNGITVKVLGSISPYCKGDRNCPGFLITYQDKKLLLDCGNGISRLLSFPDDLKNLHVFISHLHKDHFGDLSAIQYASYVFQNYNLIKDKVQVYLPEEDYLDNKSAITKMEETYVAYNDINENVEYEVDDIKIKFRLNHAHNIKSYAIKLEKDDVKIVYTSDIGSDDMDGLIEFCRDINLLICESSFVKSHNATSKRHFHAHEAATLAKESNAEKLLLTHFWPETSTEEYLEETKTVFSNTYIAREKDEYYL